MTLAKYVSIGRISLDNSFVYFSDFIASSAFIGLIIFIFINLWGTVYAVTPGIRGFTLTMMIWYLVMTEAIVISPGRVLEEIGDEIQSGDIANSLNKPYNYILFKYASTLAKTVLRFITTFIISAVIALIFVGGFHLSLISLPVVLLSVFLALTLNFLMMAFLGVLIFWLQDSTAIYFLYQKIVFLFGGMLYPLELFPAWLSTVASILPFSYVAYHPAKLWVHFTLADALSTIAFQLGWIILFIIGIWIAYTICIKKISINGG